MKICILGNSHAAALKSGWDSMRGAHPATDVVFFAARGMGLEGLEPRDGALVPDNPKLTRDIGFTSGGRDRIDIAAYDHFLVYALGLLLLPIEVGYSSAVLAHTVRDTVAHSLCFDLASRLRLAGAKSVLIGHTPQPALPKDPAWSTTHLTYDDLFSRLASETAAAGFELLRQPADTMNGDWSTRPALTSGSTRLDIGDDKSNKLHPPRDLVHMNAEYGRRFLESLFDRLAALDANSRP